ncbi:hypothetical protein CEP53_012231 [Fusarium sp. AF-6]|nr:hypothetical protein CEP53_012231 [Fusarium sp. AF-6]
MVVAADPSSLLATGYESPSEENPPFIAGAGDATPVQIDRPVTAVRPPLVQRPSYIAAIAPDDRRNPTRMLNSASTPTSNSLNHVMAIAEKSPVTPKVGIRDRIACHRWTYFTMTMSTGGVANILHSRKPTQRYKYHLHVSLLILLTSQMGHTLDPQHWSLLLYP